MKPAEVEREDDPNGEWLSNDARQHNAHVWDYYWYVLRRYDAWARHKRNQRISIVGGVLGGLILIALEIARQAAGL